MRLMLVILTLAATSTSYAQTSAKQGQPPTPSPFKFRSPMVIETPLLVARVDPLYKTISMESQPEIRDYICDNVSIASLRMKLQDAKAGLTELAVEVNLKNRHGHDKRVTLEFEVLNGEESIAAFRIDDFEAKEDRTTVEPRIGKVKLARGKLVREPMTRLRITMTVVDD
jgi:hypothetical protein